MNLLPSLFVALVTIFQVKNVSCQGEKSSKWFEETIDEFIRNAQDTGEGTDIQVSTCKISSQQLVATAQATAARVLQGVCNPNEIEDRFHNLETQMGSQLNVLKEMLLSLEDKLVDKDQEEKRHHRRVLSLLASNKQNSAKLSGTGGGSTVIDDSEGYGHAYTPSVSHRAQEIVKDYEDWDERRNTIAIKSGQIGPRSQEMMKYNSAVHMEKGRMVFTYYWVIVGIDYKLKSWAMHRALRSNSFYIGNEGYRMYLKFIPRYRPSVMYALVGLTKGDYDHKLEWPFHHKMRLAFLSQQPGDTRPGSEQDLKSRYWDPKTLCSDSNWKKPIFGDNQECVGLGFPYEVLNESNLVWNDRMILKLTVYLN